MTHLVIQLLGSFQVTVGGRPVPAFRSDKLCALLAYLVLESAVVHRRTTLVELLWPNMPAGAGLSDLRQALFRLRRHLGDHRTSVPSLLVTTGDVQFNPVADYWLDVTEFRSLIGAPLGHHDHAEALCGDCAAVLARAIDLYRGSLLPGLSLTHCVEFDDWLLVQQETLHEQALAALGRLTRYLEDREDYASAARYAQRAIELDPCHEPAHRARMRALARCGRTSEALKQFARLREVLARESELKPSTRTTRLYESIRSGAFQSAGSSGRRGRPSARVAPVGWAAPSEPVPSVGCENDLTEYRLARIAEWSQPRYRVDGRYVALRLLVDRGEEAAGDRWMTRQERFNDLRALLAAVRDPVVVVLGPPGSGKSTLLRHLELDTAMANLNGEDGRDTVTFFVQLNQYRARFGQALPDPGDWLAAAWSARHGNLPPLDHLLAQGRMVLLLDALNEMPAPSEREFRGRIKLWKDWVNRLIAEKPGNRVVFSCRTLDYSAPLSTPTLRVPQVRIEPFTDDQVREFLRVSSPARGEEIWAAIAGTPQLEVLRAPFFLALLADRAESTGHLPPDRAELFTGCVRRALRREAERDNPHLAPETLLSRRDLRRIALWQWRDSHDLPDQGALVPGLSALAYRMQRAAADGEASQVRVSYGRVPQLLPGERSDDILRAGSAIGVLDEDPASGEIMYRHQLVQEYFAARLLATHPDLGLVRAEWRAAHASPDLAETIDDLAPEEALPMLPKTGWEETAILAATMTATPDELVRSVADVNLALAGRIAAHAEVRPRLPGALLDDVRRALATRSRLSAADLRDRIACAFAMGDLGDPRLDRRDGSFGPYLMPPLVGIPVGVYPIGDDAPIEWALGLSRQGSTTAHMPGHKLAVDAFLIATFPVTNAEWALFLEGGGYEDERWWDTPDSRRWRLGDLVNPARTYNNRWWRRRFQQDPQLFESMVRDGSFPNEAMVERWRAWMALGEEAFERALVEHWQPKRRTEPTFWRDERCNRPSQPVVGVCWYEARAYCNWLSAQTGLTIRLPSEVELEAAARGFDGRRYPWGEEFDRLKANTCETHVRRATPVGVFPDGDTPEGVADLAGNVFEWTSSLWGEHAGEEAVCQYPYPYDRNDGREAAEASASIARVSRGGSWFRPGSNALSAYRGNNLPDSSGHSNGFRLVANGPPVSERIASRL